MDTLKAVIRRLQYWWYQRDGSPAQPIDPLRALAERHRGLWQGVNADEYVRSLREGFE